MNDIELIHTSLEKKIDDRTAKICMVGLGYVGLPTAIFFAEMGYYVIGADIDEEKVKKIRDGRAIYKDLRIGEKLNCVLKNGKFSATNDVIEAVSKSDVIIITVPTPVTVTKEPDLSHVISAAESITKGLKKGQLIILESTTYPGTTEECVKPVLETTGLKAGVDFGLTYCPERYNPGDVGHTIDNVARVVGGITLEWAEIAKKLYKTIIKKEISVVRNIKTAEAAKIVENIQRDLNIALVNEFALIFEKLNIDVMEVLDAASTKWNFIKYKPGPGVGGHCLPVDPYYLTHKARELGYYPKLILAGRSINDYMPTHVVELIIDGLNNVGKCVRNSKIAILGLAYKSNTGDIRESPAIHIVETLLKMSGKVYVHDPLVGAKDCEKYFEVKNSNFEDALKDADCVVHLVNHVLITEKLTLDNIKKIVKKDCVIVDTQYFFSPKDVLKYGYFYKGIGRGNL